MVANTMHPSMSSVMNGTKTDPSTTYNGFFLFIKAGADAHQIGPCLHCQKIFMYMIAKGLKFSFSLVDMRKNQHKVKELSPGGKLPILAVYENGEATTVKDGVVEIEQYLQKANLGEDRVGDPEADDLVTDLLTKFSAYIRNKDPNNDLKLKHGLYVKLEHINNYLNNCGMKLLSDDDEVTLPDCALLPRLFHIVHACHGIKGVKVQDETTNLTALWEYYQRGKELKEFEITQYDPADVVAYWNDMRK
ncbi:chloride intracellular channel protein 3-like isoform X2 [Convolutriloba macropyga]|uniref:chloride intracellular channel protein 3-like isoform X2 n=1 Tax=Convolutriloba macropyga TaxID=536237 RepID=UPI003F51D005